MNEVSIARYDRTSSPGLRELLRSDGFLAPLREKRKVPQWRVSSLTSICDGGMKSTYTAGLRAW